MRGTLVGKVAIGFAAFVLLAIFASGALADDPPPGGSGSSAPATVATDQSSYRPGDTVHVTGANWLPTETVHVHAAAAAGPFTYDADVVAGADGSIDASFVLPSDYADTFAVAASGLEGSVSTSFSDAFAAAPAPPSIVSDQNDYPPGSLVTLTGAGWGAGESVSIVVNDTIGQTWRYTGTATADASGAFTTQVQLPNYFVSDYDVTATGANGEVATTRFTDGNVTSLSGTVTDSVTHAALAGVTVTCDTTSGCNNTFTTTTDASGAYSFSGGNKLTFGTNGPVTLTIRFSKTGYTTGTITLTNVHNGDSFSNENIALTPSKQDQTITFAQPATPQSYGATFNVNPTASSGLPVTVTAHAGSVCTVAAGSPGFDVTMTASSGNCVLDANQAGNAQFNAAPTVSKTVAAQKADSITTVSCPASVVYSGSAQTPCTAVVTGVGGLTQSLTVSYSNNTNAGTAAASATYGGDSNHNSSSDSKTFQITVAASTTTVTCPTSVTYDGSAQTPCTASVTGAGGLSQSLTVSYSNNTGAGTATASASFAGDANHSSSSDSKGFTIGKAGSTTMLTCPTSVTYDGSAQTPCTASVTGAGGLNQSLTVSYSNNTDAGAATASASFAGDANHESSSDSKGFTIDKADSTTVVTCPASVTYDSTAQEPCTASATGAGALNQPLTVSYSNNTNAGNATASASFAGDANHKSSSDSKGFTIDKADSTTAVTCPTSVTYDSTAQTPCSAVATGVGGLNQSLTVSYTDNTNAGTAHASAIFGGDANHNGSNDSTTFEVKKAASAVHITWAGSTYDGTPNGASATASGVAADGELSPAPGLTYYPGSDTSGTALAGAPTDAGTYTVLASFAGNDNYNPTSDTKTITIAKAASSTTVNCPTAHLVYNGTSRTPCSAEVNGAGGLHQSLSVTYTDNTDAGTAHASANYPGDSNHEESSDASTFVIDQATPTVTVDWDGWTYDTSAHEATGSVSGVGSPAATLGTPDTFTYYSGSTATPPALPGAPTDAGTYTVVAHYNGSANYTAADSAPKTVVVGKATPTVTADWSGWTYDMTAHAATGSVAGAGSPAADLGNPNSFAYYDGSAATPPALAGAPKNAGTYTVVAHYNGSANYTAADSAPVTVTIDKATPTVSVSWSGWTYDGTAHPATGSVTGAGTPAEMLGNPTSVTYYDGPDTTGSVLAGAPANAGTYTVVAHYSGSVNYTAADSAPKSVTVDKATPLVTITWADPQTFDGSPHPAAASVTGVGSPAAILGPADTLTYYSGSTASGTALAGAPTDAGTYTVEADYNATQNYNARTATKTITINKAASSTLVTCPASVTYTATAQTPCTAAVTGAGGLNQSLVPTYTNNTAVGTATAAATYAGDANHDGSSDSETFKIVYGAGEVQFLQPINGTAHNLSTNPDVSTFKAGSTVPVKVQIKLPNGTIVHPASALWLTPANAGATNQVIDETVSTDAPSSGPSYGWDNSGLFYQYNWGTSKSGAGHYWLIGVKLDDGQTYTVYISLR